MARKAAVAESLLSIADISRHFSLPESTTRYYTVRKGDTLASIAKKNDLSVNDLKRILARLDPKAFVTIGVTQEALGQGFGDLSLGD